MASSMLRRACCPTSIACILTHSTRNFGLMWSLSKAFTSAFKKLDPIAIRGRPQSWGRLSRPVAGIVKVGPIQWWPHTERVRLVPVRRVCNPIRVAEESACAPLRLLIMVVDRAGMQFLHYGQDSSPRARGDEQPTG